ncbi:MAG TPA: hypothetical protein V6D48_09810 [Oculatellaceae cyanobacterium]
MYRRPELEVKWPNLSRTDYQVTSPKSQEYNCFSWAAENTERWWQPNPTEREAIAYPVCSAIAFFCYLIGVG